MTTRLAKQIVYGAFYAVVWFFILWGVYALFIKSTPSCFDGKQDQGEQGIDCGGPCANACTTGVPPIAVRSVYEFVPSPNHVTLLAQIDNPNQSIAAQYFNFLFTVEDASGTTLASFPGSAFLYANELKYIVLVNEPLPGVGLDMPVQTSGSSTASNAAVSNPSVSNKRPLGTASITLGIPMLTISDTSTRWVASSSFGPPPALAAGSVSTKIASSSVIASGFIKDNDTASFSNVFVVAIFKDAAGNPIGVSQTEIDSIAPNTSQPFSISYPFIAGINPGSTEVEAYAMR